MAEGRKNKWVKGAKEGVSAEKSAAYAGELSKPAPLAKGTSTVSADRIYSKKKVMRV